MFIRLKFISYSLSGQKLLEDIVQDKVVFFSTELIASRMKFDERMQEAEKTIQRLKDEIVAINQDALSEVIEDFEEPPPSEGGPSKRSSLVGTISLDPGFLNSISEQQAQATNSEKARQDCNSPWGEAGFFKTDFAFIVHEFRACVSERALIQLSG